MIETLRGTDIMLVDQILRGRIATKATVLDAGCGGGRNLAWFISQGQTCWGYDHDPAAVETCRRRVAHLGGAGAAERITLADLAEPPHPGPFDLVICNAVLHFLPDRATIAERCARLFALVAPGGLLFARLASTIGLPPNTPGGGFTTLVDLPFLRQLTADLGAELADPIKTTNVQDQRCMTTWVLRRP